MGKYLVHLCGDKLYLISNQGETLGWYTHLKDSSAATDRILNFKLEAWAFRASFEEELINDGNPLVARNVFEGTLKEIHDWVKLNKMLE